MKWTELHKILLITALPAPGEAVAANMWHAEYDGWMSGWTPPG